MPKSCHRISDARGAGRYQNLEETMMQEDVGNVGQGIGSSVLRKEADRHMRGRGRFIPDFKMAGLSGAAFVRTPSGFRAGGPLSGEADTVGDARTRISSLGSASARAW